MNIRPLSSARLEQALAARLRALLAQVEWLHGVRVEPVSGPDAGFDLLATLPLADGSRAALCVECKSELRPSLFRQLTDRKFSPPGKPAVVVRVLALPWISPRIAELCAEAGWSWFDLAGNHRLDVPGRLHLERTGSLPVQVRPRPTANLSTPEAGRVVRALLLPENATKIWTQRNLAEHFSVLRKPIPRPSLGLVNKVVRHLREEAYVEQTAEGFHLNDPLKLLFAWRDVYRFDRHERRNYFTLLQGRKLREALYGLELIPTHEMACAAYAAFSAAEFQAPHVRQPKTWLYLTANLEGEFCKSLDARVVDSGENIIVMIPDDEGVFYELPVQGIDDQRMACTNAVQTYVDLWHCGGRGEEAAEALLEQRLKPEWKAKGLKV